MIFISDNTNQWNIDFVLIIHIKNPDHMSFSLFISTVMATDSLLSYFECNSFSKKETKHRINIVKDESDRERVIFCYVTVTSHRRFQEGDKVFCCAGGKYTLIVFDWLFTVVCIFLNLSPVECIRCYQPITKECFIWVEAWIGDIRIWLKKKQSKQKHAQVYFVSASLGSLPPRLG